MVDQVERNIFKALPYIVSVIFGIILYFIGIEFSNNLNNLFMNLAASFFTIPLFLVFYESIDNFSKRKLNKKILRYAKKSVDTEILSIALQVNKIIFPIEKKDCPLFSDVKFDNFDKVIQNNEFLGFHLFKSWNNIENNIENILKTPIVNHIFDGELIICILEILSNIRSLKIIQNYDDFAFDIKKETNHFQVIKNPKGNNEDTNCIAQFLLTKKIDNEKIQLCDFGNISKENLDKTLKYFKINPKYYGLYSWIIFRLLESIKNWKNLSGKELFIDNELFSVIYSKKYINITTNLSNTELKIVARQGVNS